MQNQSALSVDSIMVRYISMRQTSGNVMLFHLDPHRSLDMSQRFWGLGPYNFRQLKQVFSCGQHGIYELYIILSYDYNHMPHVTAASVW